MSLDVILEYTDDLDTICIRDPAWLFDLHIIPYVNVLDF